jgi:hypothetical protein
MQSRCSSIQAELESANNGTQSLLERAKGLQEQQQVETTYCDFLTIQADYVWHYAHRASTRLRSDLSGRFLAHFTLSQQETDTLNAKDVNINEQLFLAMDRVKKIREDCTDLFTLAGVGTTDVTGGERKVGGGERDEEGDGVEGRDPALAA